MLSGEATEKPYFIGGQFAAAAEVKPPKFDFIDAVNLDYKFSHVIEALRL